MDRWNRSTDFKRKRHFIKPLHLKKKFALPEIPNLVSDSKVPSGTNMRMGSVVPNYGNPGGAIQLELLERVEFTNTRTIGEL